MGRRPIGVVKDLFRYPVKSMLGERLIEVDIGESGVIGDRAYALREASGRVVTAKKWPALFEFSARYDRSPSPGEAARSASRCRMAGRFRRRILTPLRYCPQCSAGR